MSYLALSIDMMSVKVEGMSVNYVNELLRCGTPDFRRNFRKTHECFNKSDKEELKCIFVGFNLAGDRDSWFLIDQNLYQKTLIVSKHSDIWRISFYEN